jgi:hypothetical protein
MTRRILGVIAALTMAVAGFAFAAGAGKPEWAMNATAIEACSCPMFCQCYFNAEPAGHHEHGKGESHYCRANMAFKINKGHHGATPLDGVKFWMANDLGAEFNDGEMEWNVLYFDKGTTPEQRAAIQTVAQALFPVKWKSFTTAEGTIDTWTFDENTAVATLDGGKTAEIRLRRAPTAMGAGPVVIKNLTYWGAPRNDGFILMPNEVEAYRVGPKAFEYKGTNGFMITVDINSDDVAARQAAAKPAS